MEDIEYLEEYEDLVLPVINSSLSDATTINATANSGLTTLNEEMSNNKTSSRSTADIVHNQLQQVADSDSSSSLDQDIFNCLFDDHSDDDNVLLTKGDINATEKSDLNMYSMDSMDTFVKKIGEQVLNETSSAVAKTDKPSTSKNDSYNSLNKTSNASSSSIAAGMPRGKETKIATTSNVEARKSITRTPMKATIIPSKSLIKQKPPKNLMSTSTSNVSNYQANRKVPSSMAKVATKKQPHTTIVKLEKVIREDPINDPLNLEDDTLSDVASDLLSLSDISGHTIDNLSVLDDDDDDDDDDMLNTRKTIPNSPSDDEENDFMHNTQIMDLSNDSSVLSRNLQNIVTTSQSLVPKRGAVASTCTTITINTGPHDVGFKATPSNQSNRGLDLMVAADDKNLELIDILSDNFREDDVVGDYTNQTQIVSDVNLGSSVESSSDAGRTKNISSASSDLYSTSSIATSTSAIMETLPPKAIIISDTILTPYNMPFTNFQASSLGNTTTNLPKFTTTTTSTLPQDHPTSTVESSNTNVFTQTPDPIKPIEITIRTMEAPSSSSAASTALGNIISPSGLSNDSYLSAVDEMLEESYAEAMLKLKAQQEMLHIQDVGAEMEVSYIDNLDFLNADDVQNKLILEEQQPSQPSQPQRDEEDDVLQKNQAGKEMQQQTNLVTSLSDKTEQKGNEQQQQRDKIKDDVLEKNQAGKQMQQQTNLVTSLSDKTEQKGNEQQQQQRDKIKDDVPEKNQAGKQMQQQTNMVPSPSDRTEEKGNEQQQQQRDKIKDDVPEKNQAGKQMQQQTNLVTSLSDKTEQKGNDQQQQRDKIKDDVLEKNQAGKQMQQQTNLVTSLSDKTEQRGNEQQQQQTIEDNMTVMFRALTPSQQEQQKQQEEHLKDSKDTTEEKPQQQLSNNNKVATKSTATKTPAASKQHQQTVGGGKLALVIHTNPQQQHEKKCKTQKYQQQQQQLEIKILQKHQQQKQHQSNDNKATIKQGQHQSQKQHQQHFRDNKVGVASQSGHHQRKERSQSRDNKSTELNNTTKQQPQQQQSCNYKSQASKQIAEVLDKIHNKEKSTQSRNESAKQTIVTSGNSEKPTSSKTLKTTDSNQTKNKIEIKDNREPALKTVHHEANVNKKLEVNTKLNPKESKKTPNANKDPRVSATDTKTTNVDLPRSSIKEEKICDKSVENIMNVVERKQIKESLKRSTTKIEEHKKANENNENKIKDATPKIKTNTNEMKKTKDMKSNQPTTTTVTLINDENAGKEAAKEMSPEVVQRTNKEKIELPKKGQEEEETNKIAEKKSNVAELEKEGVKEKSGIKSNYVLPATTASKAKDAIKTFDSEKNPTSDKKMENVKTLHEDRATAYKLPAAKDKKDICAEKSLQTEKEEFKAELKNIGILIKDSKQDMTATPTTTKPTQQTKKKRFRNLRTPDSSDEDFKDGLNDFIGFEEEANLKIVIDNKEVKTTSEDNNMATVWTTTTNSKEEGDEMKETNKKSTRWDSLTNKQENVKEGATQSIITLDKEIINDKNDSDETKMKSCTTETVKLTKDSANQHKEEEKTEQKDAPRSSKESSNETNEVKKLKSFIEIKTNLNKNNELELVQDETKIKDNLAPKIDKNKTDEKVPELPTTISIQAKPELETTLTTNADTTSTNKKLQDKNSENLENKSIKTSEKTDKDKMTDKEEETITSKPVLPVEAKTSTLEDDEKCTESPRNETSKVSTSKNTSLPDNKTTNNTNSATDTSRDGKRVENPKPSAKQKRSSQDSEGSRDSSKERKSSKDSNNIGKHRKDSRTSCESNESKECTEARESKNDIRQSKSISRHSSRDSNNSDKRSDTRASSSESVKKSKEKIPPKQQVFPSPRTKTQTKLSSTTEGKVIFSTKEVMPKQSVNVENKNVRDDKLPARSEAHLKQGIKDGEKWLEKKDNTLEVLTGVDNIKKILKEEDKTDEEKLIAVKMPQLLRETKEALEAEIVKDNPVEGQEKNAEEINANKSEEINANKLEDSAQKIVDKKDYSLKKEQEEERKEGNEEEESAKSNNATELQKNPTQPTEATEVTDPTVAKQNKCDEVEKAEETVKEIDNETNQAILKDLKTPNDQQQANNSSSINSMEDKSSEVVKEIIRMNTKESVPQNSDIAKKETNEKEPIPDSQETLINTLKLTVESSSSPNPKIIDEEFAKKSRSASESSQCVSPTNSVTSQSSKSRRTPNPDNTPLRRTLRKRGVGSPFLENETEKKVFKEPVVPLGGDSKSESITEEDASPSSAKKAKLDTQRKSLRPRKSQPLEGEQDNMQLATKITAPLTEATNVEEKSKQTSKEMMTNNEVSTERQRLDEGTHTKARKEQTKKTEQSSPLQENPTHSSSVRKNVRSDDNTKQHPTKTSGNSLVRKEPPTDKPQSNKTNDLSPKSKAINTTTSNLSNVISFSEWLQAQKKRKNQDQELYNKSSSTSRIQTQTKSETVSKIEPAVTLTEEKVKSTVDKKSDIATETIDAEAKSKAGKANLTPQVRTAESGSIKMPDVKSCDDSVSSIDTTSTENLSETPKPRVKLSESQMLMASWSKTMKESGLDLLLNQGKPEKRQRSSSSRKRQLMKDLEKSKEKNRGSHKVKDKNLGIWKIVDKASDTSQIRDKQIDKSSITYRQVQTSNPTEHKNQCKILDKMTANKISPNQIEKLDNGNRAEKKVSLQMDTPPIQASTQSNVGKGRGKSRMPPNSPKGRKKSLITVHLTTPTKRKRSNLKSAESEKNLNSNSNTLAVSKLLSSEVKVGNHFLECREVRVLLNRSFVSRYMKLQLHKKYSLTPNDSHSLLEELLSLPPKPFTKAQFPSLITNRTTTTPLNKAITNHSVMAYPTPVATASAYSPKTMNLMQNNSETALRICPVIGHPSIIEKTIENKLPEQKLKNKITEAPLVYRPSKRMKAMTTSAKIPSIIASTTSLPKPALSSTIIGSISSSTTSTPTTISTIPKTTATTTTAITTISGFNVLNETSQVVTIPVSADPLPDVTNLEAMMAVKPKNEIDDDDNLPCTLPDTSTLLAHAQTNTASATSAINSLATNRTAIRVVPNMLNTAAAATAADNINTPGFGLNPPLVDGKCTRIYSFLHPARYANSHGNVLLDYCCPNLNGPMPAIDPQRIHAQVQVPVRELPAYVVLDTKVITRAELESGSIKVPDVVRQKVEKYRNSATATTINESGNIRPILRGGPPAILKTFADNSNANRMLSPTVNALAKHLPRTTTITAKVRPPPPPPPPPSSTMTTTTNAPNEQKDYALNAASAIPPLVQIGTEPPVAQPRTQLKHLDNVLKKFVNPYDSLTFAERHRIMESIVASGTFSCNDVEKMILLLEGYYKQIELLKRTTPSGSNSLATRPAVVKEDKDVASQLSMSYNNVIAAMSGTKPLKQQKPTGVKSATKSSATEQVPIYDTDQNIIGYQMRTIKSLPVQRTSTPMSATSNVIVNTSNVVARARNITASTKTPQTAHTSAKATTSSSSASVSGGGGSGGSLNNSSNVDMNVTRTRAGRILKRRAQEPMHMYYSPTPSVKTSTSAAAAAATTKKSQNKVTSTPSTTSTVMIKSINKTANMATTSTITSSAGTNRSSGIISIRKLPIEDKDTVLRRANITTTTIPTNHGGAIETITTTTTATIKRVTRKRAAASSKIIVMSKSSGGSDESILPDDNRQAVIKHELTDEEVLG